jgi:hypothetical protein
VHRPTLRTRGATFGVLTAALLSLIVGANALAADNWDRYGVRYPATSGTVTGAWYYTSNTANGNFAPECQLQARTQIVVKYGTVTASYMQVKSVVVTYYVVSRTYGKLAIPMSNLVIADGKGASDSYSGSGQSDIYWLTSAGQSKAVTYAVNKTYAIGPNSSNWWSFLRLKVAISAPYLDCQDSDWMTLYSYYSKPL